jgi:hypothetical protein
VLFDKPSVPSGQLVVDVPGGQLVGSQEGDGPSALILHGGPAADASRQTAALLPQATLALVPQCGHFPWLEQPDAFLAALAPALDVETSSPLRR